MKAKKVLAFILASIAITSLFAGCADNKNEGEATTAKIIEATTKKIDINTGNIENIELEKIDVSQTESVSKVKREPDGTIWTVTAAYDTANETVSEITIAVAIPESARLHDSTVAKYETAKADLDKLGDPDIIASFIKAEGSTIVEMNFKALNEADRIERIKCIEGILDIEADEDYSFCLQSLDAGLTLRAFKDS